MGAVPFWYLLLAAALPGDDHDEHLADVIKPVLALADKQQRPCYTEVTNPKNLPVLQRLGFEVYEDTTLFGEVLSLLLRPPAPAP